MATLRERGDGAFYMGFRPNGRRYRRSLRTRNPSIAQRRLREIQAQLELGLLREPSKTTIREFVSTFLDHQEGRRRPRTVTTQRKKLALFLEHVGTDGGISQIRPLHVSTFLDSLEVGPPTCSRYRSALHRLFEHAITRGELEMNPVRRVPAQKEEKKPPRFLAGEDRDRLLAEISRMTWEDVDFKGRKVTVPVAKSKKFRVVPLHRRLERGSPGRPRRARVLARRRPMDPDTLTTFIRRVAKKLDLQEKLRGPHTLRETFASLAVQAGEDVYRVREWLGHSSVAVTERTRTWRPGGGGRSMRSKRGWIKTLALISLACVALLTIEGVADYLEAWKRSAEEKARFRPGSIHTVIQTINLCDEDGVPVRQVSPGDLIGIEKRGFGRRMVYVVSQLPTVRGWVDFGILKASTREGSPWEKEEDR